MLGCFHFGKHILNCKQKWDIIRRTKKLKLEFPLVMIIRSLIG
jgi:hypothetical protein